MASNATLSVAGYAPANGGHPGKLDIKCEFSGNYLSGRFLLKNAINAATSPSPKAIKLGDIRAVRPGRSNSSWFADLKKTVKRAGAPAAVTAAAFAPVQPFLNTTRIILTAVSTANPAVFTKTAHGLVIGDIVQSFVFGTAVTALNGVFRVLATPDANTFTLEALDGTDVSGAGSTFTDGWVQRVTAARVNLTVVAHQLLPGEKVRLRQVLGATTLNTTSQPWEIVAIPSVDIFTVQTNLSTISAFAASANSRAEVERPFPDMAVSAVTRNADGTITFTSAGHELVAGQDEVFFTGNITGLTPAWQDSNKKLTVIETPTSGTFKCKLDTRYTAGTATAVGMTACLVRSIRALGMLALQQATAIGLASVSVANPAVYTTQSTSVGVATGDILDTTLYGTLGTIPQGLVRVSVPVGNSGFNAEAMSGAPVDGTTSTITANTGLVAGVRQLQNGLAYDGSAILSLDLIAEGAPVWQGPLLV